MNIKKRTSVVSKCLANCLAVFFPVICVTDIDAREPGKHSHFEWKAKSPRAEIKPTFSRFEDQKHGGEILKISADEREGLAGHWESTVRVEPGQYYQFSCWKRTTGMLHERRVAIVRLRWTDLEGQAVFREQSARASYRASGQTKVTPEFPADQHTEAGWTRVSGAYVAPPKASKLHIELHFRWGAPGSSVEWSAVQLKAIEKPAERIVRLATVHYQPRAGRSASEKRTQFEPFIAQAAKQGADLVVLPETLTYYGSGGSYIDAAEEIPGPTTDYFGDLAKQYQTHIVAGLLERDEHLVYNVAVLFGPKGKLIGKFRKVTLPRSEIEGGLTPGDEYPVFDTDIGKIGMMICYDGFFPEVARELSNNGAEIIAWPVWGCNPLLAAARACENHVFIVSSTYTSADAEWMVSAIFDRTGDILEKATEFGSIAIAEVNLDQPVYWHSLGDFKAQIERHRPILPTRDTLGTSTSK